MTIWEIYRKLKEKTVDRTIGELALEKRVTCNKVDCKMNEKESG
jgi:hypothetical protein